MRSASAIGVSWGVLLALLIAAQPLMVDRPLDFGPERVRLTIEYRRLHEDPSASTHRIAPRVIVLHHTATPTLEAALATFAPARLGASRKDIARGGALNVSAHFLVDRDGSIVRLLEEDIMARHTIGLNHVSIGIENVGGTPQTPLTEAQIEANAALVRALKARFPAITHLIGHHEAASMRGSPLYVERLSGYRTVKIDPGDAFMRAVRARVEALGLEGPKPAK